MENQFLIRTLLTGARLFHYPLGRIFKCPPALFLHIQKTAGSSIVDLLQKFYRTTILVSSGDYVGKRPEQLSRLEFIHGHFGYDYAKDLMRGRYTFTFLRHPGERILSLYYFCLTRDRTSSPFTGSHRK